MNKVKFVQIAVLPARTGLDKSALFGLDENGQVWVCSSDFFSSEDHYDRPQWQKTNYPFVEK